MKSKNIFKISLYIFLALIVLVGCENKVGTNSSSDAGETINANELITNSNAPQNNESVKKTEDSIMFSYSKLDFYSSGEGWISKIINNETKQVLMQNLSADCDGAVMPYLNPQKNNTIFLQNFNPGSDRPIHAIYSLNLYELKCKKLGVSSELADFGKFVPSPDESKLAVALETNEAKKLILLDLMKDTAKVLVKLPEGETFNAGYGAMSNSFEIKWLDNNRIQYSVFKDTINNYDFKAPRELEEKLREKIININ